MTKYQELSNFPDPAYCYYYSYMCSVCERLFRLIDPDEGYCMGGIVIRLPSSDLFKQLSETEDISD
jgi:hypothetical protein